MFFVSSTGHLREEIRSGTLNNIHVLSTGGYVKASRGGGAMRNDNFTGSGRSSRSSSIASDRSGSLNSLPGSVASSESST